MNRKIYGLVLLLGLLALSGCQQKATVKDTVAPAAVSVKESSHRAAIDSTTAARLKANLPDNQKVALALLATGARQYAYSGQQMLAAQTSDAFTGQVTLTDVTATDQTDADLDGVRIYQLSPGPDSHQLSLAYVAADTVILVQAEAVLNYADAQAQGLTADIGALYDRYQADARFKRVVQKLVVGGSTVEVVSDQANN